MPYSWTLDQVECATNGSHGFAFSDLTDSTFLACRATFNTGDGYNFNVTSASASGANTRLIGCIAEENNNGFNLSSNTSAFAHTFYGCSTQNNNANGFLAASTSTDGLIQLVGCRFWEDGQNAGSGGGSYAGINLDALTGDVLISGCSVLPNNTGTPTVPEYGLSMTSCTGQVTVASSEIWGYTQAIYNGGGNTRVHIADDVTTGTGTLASPTRGPEPYPPQMYPLLGSLPDALNGTSLFTTGIGSWTGNNSATAAWSAGPGAYAGLGTLGITGNGSTASPGGKSEEFTVVPNHFYSAAALVYAPSAWSPGLQMLVNWFTSGGTYISTSAGQTVALPAAGWVLCSLNGVKSPGTAGKAQMIVQIGGTPANTVTFSVLCALFASGTLDGFFMPLASSQVQGTTDWLNVVTMYNADPTGATDSSTAINNALSALPSGGGTVYFPAGTYQVSVALSVPTGATLQGAGQDAAIISQTSTTADTLSATDQRYITVRDLQLTGPSSGTGRGIAFLYSASAVASINLENLIVQDFGGDGVHLETVITSALVMVRSQSNGGHGFFANNGTSVSFKACYANANTGNGYELDAMNYMQLDSCAADNDTIGYSINGSSAVVLNACGSEDCTDGYKVLGASANIVLQGCKVLGETGDRVLGHRQQRVLLPPRLPRGIPGRRRDRLIPGRLRFGGDHRRPAEHHRRTATRPGRCACSSRPTWKSTPPQAP